MQATEPLTDDYNRPTSVSDQTADNLHLAYANLTNRQKLFVDHYINLKNATQSAIKAGYSPRSARSIASENMAKPAIKLAIRERLKGEFETRDWTPAEIRKKFREFVDDEDASKSDRLRALDLLGKATPGTFEPERPTEVNLFSILGNLPTGKTAVVDAVPTRNTTAYDLPTSTPAITDGRNIQPTPTQAPSTPSTPTGAHSQPNSSPATHPPTPPGTFVDSNTAPNKNPHQNQPDNVCDSIDTRDSVDAMDSADAKDIVKGAFC